MRVILALILGAMMLRNLLGGLGVNVHLALITLALVAGFASGLYSTKTYYERVLYKERHITAVEREKASEEARVQEANWRRKTEEAVALANDKARALAASALSNRRMVDGLRWEISNANRLAEGSESAARQYAATLGKLFGECSESYREMAERAEGHAIDAERLRAAWPQEK